MHHHVEGAAGVGDGGGDRPAAGVGWSGRRPRWPPGRRERRRRPGAGLLVAGHGEDRGAVGGIGQHQAAPDARRTSGHQDPPSLQHGAQVTGPPPRRGEGRGDRWGAGGRWGLTVGLKGSRVARSGRTAVRGGCPARPGASKWEAGGATERRRLCSLVSTTTHWMPRDGSSCPPGSVATWRTGLVTTKGLDHCLFVFTTAGFEAEAARQSRHERTEQRARDFARTFYGGATDQPLDAHGRLALPAHLRAYAGLERDVVIVGVQRPHRDLGRRHLCPAAGGERREVRQHRLRRERKPE